MYTSQLNACCVALCRWDYDDRAGGVCVGGGMFISKGINFLEAELTDKSEIVVSKC